MNNAQHEAMEASPTYAALVTGAASVRELLAVARGLNKIRPDKAVAELISRGEQAAVAMDAKAAEVRPSAGLVAWNKGQAEAARNYRPPASKPLG